MLVVMGATNREAIALDCFDKLRTNGTCDSAGIYYMWGTGATQNTTQRVQQPTAQTLESGATGFQVSYKVTVRWLVCHCCCCC
jgi:hypothetical protein